MDWSTIVASVAASGLLSAGVSAIVADKVSKRELTFEEQRPLREKRRKDLQDLQDTLTEANRVFLTYKGVDGGTMQKILLDYTFATHRVTAVLEDDESADILRQTCEDFGNWLFAYQADDNADLQTYRSDFNASQARANHRISRMLAGAE